MHAPYAAGARVALVVVLALVCIGAAPSPTPTPVTSPTPRPTSTAASAHPPPTATQIPTPRATPTRAPTPVPTPAPLVLPTLAVAPIPWLPVGSTPIVSRPWTLSPALQDLVQAAAARHRGSISVVVTNLQTGATASVNPDQQLRSASLYKLFLLQYAFAQMWTGRLSAQEQLTLGQAVADANPYTDLVVGTRSSVSCALRTMIEISSNSAADLLEQRLGDDAVNAYLRGVGLQQSYITPDRAYTSAADIARLLNGMALGQTVSPLASSQMLTMLLAQQENNRLPLPLPVGVPVAHKTGELPKLRHDAGIVYAPSGAYLLVALVSDAPDEAAARDAIVDVSEAVYNHFAPEGLPRYLGLVPRLAQEVFRVPDAQGRLPLLLDARTDTVAVGTLGVVQPDGSDEIRLRQEVVPDLLDLQQAASDAGVPFWVTAGLEQPNDGTRGKVLPTAFVAPCAMDVPPPPPTTPGPVAPATSPTATPTPTPAPARVAPQAWLGTVIRVADDPSGLPSDADEADNPTVRWLDENAWQFGFVPGLPESDAGIALGHEPWTFRWVGRQMAAAIQPLMQSESYGEQATAVLQQAEDELAADARSAAAH